MASARGVRRGRVLIKTLAYDFKRATQTSSKEGGIFEQVTIKESVSPCIRRVYKKKRHVRRGFYQKVPLYALDAEHPRQRLFL